MEPFDDKIQIASKVYSPTTPIKEEDLFIGRQKQLNIIQKAILEGGQHLILYGERGVGKTSLSNIIKHQYRNILTPSVMCNSASTLNSIWKIILSKLLFHAEYRNAMGIKIDPLGSATIRDVTKRFGLLDSQHHTSIDEIMNVLYHISRCSESVIFIFDEFDQIKSHEMIQGMSSIIKYCSDHISNFTIMLIGIGATVSELIGEHQSIDRCLKQIYLEKMSDEELQLIIENANQQIGVTMPASISKRIILYSSGFPYYTHLLGKYTTLAALNRKSLSIEDIDFKSAVNYAS